MTQRESKLSREIKNMIRAGGGYCIKIHGGPTMEAGTPDLIACIPVRCHPVDDPEGVVGQFVGIETKTPDNNRADRNGSDIQQLRAAQIRHAGGVVIIPCTSVSQARTALEELGWVRNHPYRIPARLRAPETP